MSQQEKTIVFGGSSGMGEATARLRAAAGERVIIVGRDPSRLEAARARIGAGVEAASVDAADRQALDAFFARTGAFDHLVLCHSGAKGAGPFRTLDLGDLRGGLEAKLFAQLQAAQSALATLREGGSITLVTAISARVAAPGTAGLAAINAALEAMVPTLAKELAPTRVNAVSPGVIDTPWWNALPVEAKEAFFQQATEQLPVGRVGRPEEVASAIGLLIDNEFMTGTVIEVDGGSRLQ